MDDIAKRVTNLSPTKRTLLELKLRKKIAPKSSEDKPVANDIAKRVADLSLTKRTLLELKLRKKAAAKLSENKPVTNDIAKRVSNLSPAKRALLELKLKKKAPATSLAGKLATDDILGQIANLSPAKRALLEFRLTKKDDGISSATVSPPPIITPETEVPEGLTITEPIEVPTSTTEDTQDAAESTAEPIEEPTSRTEDTQVAAEPEVTDWLTDLFPEDLETPSWLLDEVSSEEAVTLQTPAELAESFEAEEAPPLPDWMTGLGEVTEDEDAVSSPDSSILDFDDESEAPAWLSAAEDTAELSDEFQPDKQADSSPAAIASTPPRGTSRWMESLKPATETVADDEDNKTAEATGMLSGISTLLPAEKISLPTRETDSLHEAAQEFYKIATEVPQPAALPTPLTRRERAVGGVVRSVLYLLFIVLIALPLLPGTQRLVNNMPVPWSEPTGDDGDVLDSQRRQLISEELGIIDLQQPGSIALVSFDYSTATQGEMQPLAEAVIGRLKGQGMRVISVSLEPEGATIAQSTLEEILAERDDSYGVDMVNLGYLPGKMAAIRELVTSQESLSTIPDYRENVTLKARPEWEDIQSLDQVDIVVTFADNPTTPRWWVEQLEAAPQPSNGKRFLLAATSAVAEPFLRPYRDSGQLDGLISGINGAAAIEAGRNTFGQARQMIDSLGIATIIIVILIAAGTIVGWMPSHHLILSATESEYEQDESVTKSKFESSRQV